MLGFATLGGTPLGGLPFDHAIVEGAVATITVTGNDVGLYATRLLTAESASFAITFNDVELARGNLGLGVSSGGGIRGLRASATGGGRGLRIRA